MNHNTVLRTIKELVSIPSTLGQTTRVEEYVMAKLEKVENAKVEYRPVGEVGRDVLAGVIIDEDLPTILLNGHLDTVEVCEGWSRDPFKPCIEGDRLYGLGSADMKAGIGIALEAFGHMAGTGKVNVRFAGTIDEEGDSRGAFALANKGLGGDLCLIPEPSNGNVMMGCRGRLVLEVKVKGTSAHGARPEEGVNAILEASSFLNSLDSISFVEHERLGKGSICPLDIRGGTRSLSVPEGCSILIDRHYVPGETAESVIDELRELGKGSQASFDISLYAGRTTPFLEPYITGEDGLVAKFMQAVNVETSYGKSVGDYNVFAQHMPTVVYGPTGGNWHSADEWVSISSISRCVEDYARFADSL